MTPGDLVFQGHFFGFLGERRIILDLNNVFSLHRRIKITHGSGIISILLQYF